MRNDCAFRLLRSSMAALVLTLFASAMRGAGGAAWPTVNIIFALPLLRGWAMSTVGTEAAAHVHTHTALPPALHTAPAAPLNAPSPHSLITSKHVHDASSHTYGYAV